MRKEPVAQAMCGAFETRLGFACHRRQPHGIEGDGLRASVLHLPWKERIVSPLVVILILSLPSGGYGFRSGNTILGAGGGLVGLVLLILLILALMGRL